MPAAVIAHPHRFPPGGYYTDGSRLLRIMSEQAYSDFRTVEDCGSLAVILASVEELASLGLTRIAARSPHSEAPLAT